MFNYKDVTVRICRMKSWALEFKLTMPGTHSLHLIIKIKWETVKILEASTQIKTATCSLTLTV